jgi:hypothetical protein
LLVVDCSGQLIVLLNEWYLLTRGVGAEPTRNTNLAVLRPWFGFLSEHQYAWNAGPEAVREYVRLFLLDAGCALKAGRVGGSFVQATNKSPISTNGLHLLIAALRNCYEVMRRGVFDSEDQRLHPLYAFENPMYSRVLLAWRSEHHRVARHERGHVRKRGAGPPAGPAGNNNAAGYDASSVGGMGTVISPHSTPACSSWLNSTSRCCDSQRPLVCTTLVSWTSRSGSTSSWTRTW